MKTVRMIYLVFANTLVLLLFVLVALHGALLIYDHDWTRSKEAYRNLPEVVKKNYAHMKPADAEELVMQARSFRTTYEPWVGWREAPVSSRFLNIDRHGIRSNGKSVEGLEKIQDAVWFFGGSTTWGAAVTDEETIPAQLEKFLGRPVVNFGVNAFYSEQENLLMVQYLRRGYRPSRVAFLDGINERCGSPPYQEEMSAIFAKAQAEYPDTWDLLELVKPASYALLRLGARLGQLQGAGAVAPLRSPLTCAGFEKEQSLRTVHAQILAERESLCRLYALRCTTFVQPFAGMHGRHEDRTSLNDKDRRLLREKFEHLEPGWRAAGAVFISDALDTLEQHAYVDDIHYSAVASTMIARAISTHLAPAHAR